MSNLVDHAKRELELLGEDDETIEQYISIISLFADMGHSGSSAGIMIHTLHDLLQFKNLTALTDDPREWNHVGGELTVNGNPVWQSARNPEAFSHDGGKTYYLLSEGGREDHPEPLHESKKNNGASKAQMEISEGPSI